MNLTIKNLPKQIADQNTSTILKYVKNAVKYSKDKDLAFKYKFKCVYDEYLFNDYFYYSGRLLNIDGSLKSIKLPLQEIHIKYWLEVGVNINGKYFCVRKSLVCSSSSSSKIKFSELPSMHTSSSRISEKIFWEYRICSYDPNLKEIQPKIDVTYLLFYIFNQSSEFILDNNIKLTVRNLNIVLDYRL